MPGLPQGSGKGSVSAGGARVVVGYPQAHVQTQPPLQNTARRSHWRRRARPPLDGARRLRRRSWPRAPSRARSSSTTRRRAIRRRSSRSARTSTRTRRTSRATSSRPCGAIARASSSSRSSGCRGARSRVTSNYKLKSGVQLRKGARVLTEGLDQRQDGRPQAEEDQRQADGRADLEARQEDDHGHQAGDAREGRQEEAVVTVAASRRPRR